MRTLRERDALLEELWKQFGDVPMDPSTETMEAPFLDFPAGTSRVDIWHWFDERHSKGIAYLLYNEDASNAASITSLLHCQKLCTECCSETCVFNPQGICMAPFLTGKKPGIHDDGCRSSGHPGRQGVYASVKSEHGCGAGRSESQV